MNTVLKWFKHEVIVPDLGSAFNEIIPRQTAVQQGGKVIFIFTIVSTLSQKMGSAVYFCVIGNGYFLEVLCVIAKSHNSALSQRRRTQALKCLIYFQRE